MDRARWIRSLASVVYVFLLCTGLAWAVEAPDTSALKLRPAPTQPLRLQAAVDLAVTNYPKILQAQSEIRAAQKSVTVTKLNEYQPAGLMSWQDVFASHNKLTQVLFMDPVMPQNMGPGFPSVTFRPHFFSASGFIVDWAPIDFGLHRARIDASKAALKQTRAEYGVTRLDVATAAASTFLDSVIMHEQVLASEANVRRFEAFSQMVHSLASAELRPGADASLADAQLADSKNQLIRARLSEELALASLANAVGLGGQAVMIDPGEIAEISEPPDIQKGPPDFENHPFALAGHAAIQTISARAHVYDVMYYPKFRWLGGINLRGAGLNVDGRPQSANVHGIFPTVPNWNIGLIIDFPFLDIFKIRAERQVELNRLSAERHRYELIMQNLRTEDVQARAQVRAAIDLAANMPVQVQAAHEAASRAAARYQAGLGTVAQVAEAEQLLARSVVEEAVARIGVWRALLAVANVHGDLQPFLQEASRPRKREK